MVEEENNNYGDTYNFLLNVSKIHITIIPQIIFID